MADSLERLAGKMPDRHVAERLGLDVAAVKEWRRAHGIAPFLQPPPGHEAPPPKAPRAPPPLRESPHAAQLAAVRARLGTVSDDAIAAELGVTRTVVGNYRRKHGIPAYDGYRFVPGQGAVAAEPAVARPARAEPPAAAQSLASLAGTLPDVEVAQRLDLAVPAVQAWRRAHGIPPYTAPAPAAPAAPPRAARGSANDALLDAARDRLGTLGDEAIAAELGVSRTVVRYYRKKHGIPAYEGHRLPRPRAPEPERPPAPPRAPTTSERLALLHDRLGAVPDDVIARELGISRSTVSAYRREVGIAAYRDERESPLAETHRRIEALAHLVGVLPDAAVAAQAGVERRAVMHWRQGRKIPAVAAEPPRAPPVVARPAPPPPAPAPSPAPAPAPPEAPQVAAAVAPSAPAFTELRLYTVAASAGEAQRAFTAVGRDLSSALAAAEAALAARADGPWLVESAVFAGEAIG